VDTAILLVPLLVELNKVRGSEGFRRYELPIILSDAGGNFVLWLLLTPLIVALAGDPPLTLVPAIPGTAPEIELTFTG
jgi:hypothetical protein